MITTCGKHIILLAASLIIRRVAKFEMRVCKFDATYWGLISRQA